MIYESHAHFDDKAFDADRDALLASLPGAGIGRVINVSSDRPSVDSTLALAEKWPFVYAAVGIHPSGLEGLTDPDCDWLKERLSHPKAAAVGEIGLDYHWEKEEAARALQKEWFARQLSLARETGKPVIIHSREAAKDTWDVMETCRWDGLRGVMHCFSYTKETARDYLKWDFYFGIGGVVTFQNAKKLKEAVEYIPLERILLETDCPYLAPVPYRGKRSSSLYLPYVVQAIAQIKGVSADEVERVTWRNAQGLFGV